MHVTTPTPLLVIVIGVSGCGKSTLAKHLAEHFKLTFLEADDFHSAENKAHMASGKPLTDAMREPWIDSLCANIKQLKERGEYAVLAYSGLRRAHRQRFRELGLKTLFIHLTGPKDVILERMSMREGHFMPPALLDSQYEALESTDQEADILCINLNKSPILIASEAEAIVKSLVLNETGLN